jgi:hypothetical protein
MEIFTRIPTAPFFACGYMNESPLEIIWTRHQMELPPGNDYHYHPYHEYYIILAGRGALLVDGREVPMEANTVLIIAPGERHRVLWVDPAQGIQWIVIKERSAPNTKFIVPEPDVIVRQAG